MTKLVWLLLLFSLTILQSNAQGKREPEFDTTGEQEEYWAKQIFKKEYKKENHARFTGQIRRLDEYTFVFDTMKLRVINTPEELLPIFDEGLLQPSRLYRMIGNLEELTYLNHSPKIRRFRFLLYMKGIFNPTVYLFELTNESASKKTDIRTFIKGSRLTFLKQGWVMI